MKKGKGIDPKQLAVNPPDIRLVT